MLLFQLIAFPHPSPKKEISNPLMCKERRKGTSPIFETHGCFFWASPKRELDARGASILYWNAFLFLDCVKLCFYLYLDCIFIALSFFPTLWFTFMFLINKQMHEVSTTVSLFFFVSVINMAEIYLFICKVETWQVFLNLRGF